MFYSNAPLIEVIAEVRWRSTQLGLFEDAGSAPVQFTPTMLQRENEFYERFAADLDTLGFRYVERLVPPDQPGFPGQPTFRYRPSAGKSPLIQLGDGVFTANGLPPEYRRWSEFLRQVEPAIQRLVESRHVDEQQSEFVVSLRYLDAFTPTHWGELSAPAFISDVLGYKFQLPDRATSEADVARPISASMQAQVPLKSNRRLQIVVGEGTAHNAPAVLSDLVTFEENVPASASAVVDSLNEMHDIHSGMFSDVASRLGPRLTLEVDA